MVASRLRPLPELAELSPLPRLPELRPPPETAEVKFRFRPTTAPLLLLAHRNAAQVPCPSMVCQLPIQRVPSGPCLITDFEYRAAAQLLDELSNRLRRFASCPKLRTFCRPSAIAAGLCHAGASCLVPVVAAQRSSGSNANSASVGSSLARLGVKARRYLASNVGSCFLCVENRGESENAAVLVAQRASDAYAGGNGSIPA